MNWIFAFVGTHFESVVKNSQVRESGKELFEPLRYSISKSKIERMACHLAKICLDAIFWTSFSRMIWQIDNQFGEGIFYSKDHLEI